MDPRFPSAVPTLREDANLFFSQILATVQRYTDATYVSCLHARLFDINIIDDFFLSVLEEIRKINFCCVLFCLQRRIMYYST